MDRFTNVVKALLAMNPCVEPLPFWTGDAAALIVGLLLHSSGDPGSILTYAAVCVELAFSL